ncbi:MAG TPA: recombinase, partial [Butyricimonas virosa]|nr:recombinase [Butyricimonas virosa]
KDRRINNRLIPIISNQKCNDYLKEIAALCKVNKNLTCHVARHTFATTVTLTEGVPLESISKMLGHTNTVTTQIYAKIVNEKLRKDASEWNKKMVGIEDEFNLKNQ